MLLWLIVSWWYFYNPPIKCYYMFWIRKIQTRCFCCLKLFLLFFILKLFFSFFILCISYAFWNVSFDGLLYVIYFLSSLLTFLLIVILLMNIFCVSILLFWFATHLKLLFRRKTFALTIWLRLIFTLFTIRYSKWILTSYFFQCTRWA